MKALRIFIMIAAWLVAGLLVGCVKKPVGVGTETSLFVVADSENWQEMEATFKDVFENVIMTPQPERVFEIHWISPENFSQYATRKNIVIVGILDSEGEINAKVSGMLSADVKNKVMDGSAFVFPKENPWADQQLLVVLAGNSVDELKAKMMENREYLYGLFEKKLIEETTEQMFSQFEQEDLADTLLEKYGWTLRIQHDYILNIDRPQDRFVMLRRSLPGRERWLFVHWIEAADPAMITEEWALQTRDRLTRKFYENDFIDRERTHSTEIDFLGRSTLLLEGLWANDDKVTGGPFRNYSFYDQATGRIYMIDVAVWYPANLKEPFLRQLDIMAHTFKTEKEVREEKEKEGS
ncbi:MAG: DUF4837 family protein [bacterium]